jgi:hypothetical protein
LGGGLNRLFPLLGQPLHPLGPGALPGRNTAEPSRAASQPQPAGVRNTADSVQFWGPYGLNSWAVELLICTQCVQLGTLHGGCAYSEGLWLGFKKPPISRGREKKNFTTVV